jgi:hypothetical protein
VTEVPASSDPGEVYLVGLGGEVIIDATPRRRHEGGEGKNRRKQGRTHAESSGRQSIDGDVAYALNLLPPSFVSRPLAGRGADYRPFAWLSRGEYVPTIESHRIEN